MTISMMEAMATARRRQSSSQRVSIEGTEASAVSSEGAKGSMPLSSLLDQAAPESMSSGDVILPSGVRWVQSGVGATIWVHETPPQVYTFDWIAPDSPKQFGEGTTYRRVRLALPYMVMMAVFYRRGPKHLQLTSANECFFRNSPIKSPDDELCYPALLNCSKFEPQDGRPLSWICTQHLKSMGKMLDPDPNVRMRAGFEALHHCLLETGFNRSSEAHEFSSWFEQSRTVDERINTVEEWQKASEKPLFALDVPWLKTGFTLRQVVDRILSQNQASRSRVDSAEALARIIFNHKPKKP